MLLISFSTAVASIGEVHWSLRGMGLLFASIYFEALRLILTQKLLEERNLHPLEALYYISPVSFLFTAAAALLIDLPRLRSATPPQQPPYLGSTKHTRRRYSLLTPLAISISPPIQPP